MTANYTYPPLPPYFEYREGRLWLEDVALADVAEEAGTPLYLYSAGAIRANYRRYLKAFRSEGLDASLHYALKANSNLSIIRLLAQEGAGADVVSGGELERALRAGVAPEHVVFAGVGKSVAEIDKALRAQIGAFTVESRAELRLLESRAEALALPARVAFRLNPGVDAHTHAYITTGESHNKFGMPPGEVLELAQYAARSQHLRPVGLHCHIGSQILEAEPLALAAAKLAELAVQVERENGLSLEYLDLGGGPGVAYRFGQEETASPEELARLVAPEIRRFGWDRQIFLEPGRWLVANAGVLLARVLYRKESGNTRFLVVDAAMNDLLRPALYSAYHEIVPLRREEGEAAEFDVVGPVCESGDFLAQKRLLPVPQPGDLLAVMSAGAYGSSMSSNYNSRGRAAEVLVDGAGWRVVRRRETIDDQLRLEEF